MVTFGCIFSWLYKMVGSVDNLLPFLSLPPSSGMFFPLVSQLSSGLLYTLFSSLLGILREKSCSRFATSPHANSFVLVAKYICIYIFNSTILPE